MGKRKVRMKYRRFFKAAVIVTGAAAVSTAAAVSFLPDRKGGQDQIQSGITQEDVYKNPKELLKDYMACISKKDYAAMYEMLDVEASGNLTLEEFTNRNAAIYEGIAVQNMTIEIERYEAETERVWYRSSFDTTAGNISFQNEAYFSEGGDGYRLIWSDSMIFPNLNASDKVRVSVIEAERGRILDRNGRVLAGMGTALSAGIVPGKTENQQQTAAKMAEILGTAADTIQKKLEAEWVREDSFVPVQTIPKAEEIQLLSPEPDETAQKQKKLQDQLLEIPGVMLADKTVREYPLKQAAAHLTGYVQNVTAEDLEEHKGEGYTSGSVIGKSGMEGLFEKQLKGQNGSRIFIVDAQGREKQELAHKSVQNGQDVKLTIDAGLQEMLYRQFQDDKSCSAALNPQTGEVLALVSTPSFDNNDFIFGMSEEKWEALNEDADRPLFNRFRQVWCPGSSFKPVTAAAGLETGALDPGEDFGNEGLSWQADASWGGYYVTTLHACSPVNLENALIYSDNIYFAKAALKIGADNLKKALLKLGFGSQMPFEITMAVSQFSNTDEIETEIQLADSGYGQGQILINPLHLAVLYTAFGNGGNVRKPYLIYDPQAGAEDWIPQAFSKETSDIVLEGMKKVVNDPNGTAYGLHREDRLLAGKTGTAEIKAAKDDTSGTELGWMALFTVEEKERPILIVTMTEDVKGRGGSGYVVAKEKNVMDQWFSDSE